MNPSANVPSALIIKLFQRHRHSRKCFDWHVNWLGGNFEIYTHYIIALKLQLINSLKKSNIYILKVTAHVLNRLQN